MSNTVCDECGESFENIGSHWSRGACDFPSFTDRQKEVLRGLLMGDAYITRRSEENPRFGIDNTNQGFLEHLDRMFEKFSNGVSLVKDEETATDHGQELDRVSEDSTFKEQYRLTLTCHPYFAELASWYDSGEKTYPNPIDLTPTVLKYWYCGDGSLNGQQMSIACHNERDRRDPINKAFNDLLGEEPTWYDHDESTTILLSESATENAVYKMGDPPTGMHYKWPSETTIKGEHGEYDLDRGSPHPIEPDSYDACNAVLKHTWTRYGERRYCTGMAVSTFTSHGTETDYENPEFCRHHQSRAALMKQHEDQFKTGAYAKSHEHIFQHLPPHKQILANDLYKSLVTESVYDFEMETVQLEVDVSDNDFAGPETDTLVLDHPIPDEKAMRARALWFAALDFMTMESIREEQFRVAAEETHEGDSLAIGERTTVITVTDEGRVIEDKDEHHLNLPLSRVQKDYERHLKFGGVEYESEGEDMGMDARNFVLEIEPDEEEMQPESKSADSSPLTSIDEPDED